ncbi:uncharacterized protein [Porites lutea]|uniref:uncharacterized protein n=1 Tax=Porites lutea TaxID=51062 RepID=UPI003CC6AAB7
MDDGQDEASAIDVSEEDAEQKEVEMDFNALIQTTAAGVDDVQVRTVGPTSVTISSAPAFSLVVTGSALSRECGSEDCFQFCEGCCKYLGVCFCCCLESPEKCGDCLEMLQCCIDILKCITCDCD